MFSKVAAFENNRSDWSKLIERESKLYDKPNDPRSTFKRDYDRILHCKAYRRLKHKTQVFFAPENDHVCTRIEHVNHVTSISYTIAKKLGLNTELTEAIATGHDVGHAPFGHKGEHALKTIAKDEAGYAFWHEKNSLWVVDKLELLLNPHNRYMNLFLTYAVRDGIVCHSGENKQSGPIKPRTQPIDLNTIEEANQFQPFTWEGCVVKIADKIAYLGRDIEDAISLKITTWHELANNCRDLRKYLPSNSDDLNNTILINILVSDLVQSSNPDSGICLSCERFELMNGIQQFSDDIIYNSPRLKYYEEFAQLMLKSIFDVLSPCYESEKTLTNLEKGLSYCPLLRDTFIDWLMKYADINWLTQNFEDKEKKQIQIRYKRYDNINVYDISDRDSYIKAVIDCIASMTDDYVIKVFDELMRFR